MKIINLLSKVTLKRRIIWLFMITAFIPFLVTVLISYNTISSISNSKLDDTAENHLQQTRFLIEYNVNNLAQVSQQLIYPSGIAKSLNDYLSTNDPGENLRLSEEIKSELDYVTYSNASIGLGVYLDSEDEAIFSNMILRDGFEKDLLPYMGNYMGLDYYGPHISMNPLNTQYVMSTIRETKLPNGDEVYLFLEANFSMVSGDSSPVPNTFSDQAFHVMTDSANTIVYSEISGLLPRGEAMTDYLSINGSKGNLQNYNWFYLDSNQGWNLYTLVPESYYERERNNWITQIVFVTIVFIVVMTLISLLIWRMIYKPLKLFSFEIENVSNQLFEPSEYVTNISEFDNVFNQLDNMKAEIKHLISEIEKKEKRRSEMEIEKLIFQINPHFLLNTIDTVHWLALINNQPEIDKIATSLNKLLYYNLKKTGKKAKLIEELSVVEHYFELQKAKYDFDYDIQQESNSINFEQEIPKFILQPLVENAIYHGVDDDGLIKIIIDQTQSDLLIKVMDNGRGIPKETLEKFNKGLIEKDSESLGIGLSYVIKIIQSHYGDSAKITIESESNNYTIVTLRLPLDNH